MSNSKPSATDSYTAYDRPSDDDLTPARILTCSERARAAEIKSKIRARSQRRHGLTAGPLTSADPVDALARPITRVSCSATPENVTLFHRLPTTGAPGGHDHRAATQVCTSCPFSGECAFAVKAVPINDYQQRLIEQQRRADAAKRNADAATQQTRRLTNRGAC